LLSSSTNKLAKPEAASLIRLYHRRAAILVTVQTEEEAIQSLPYIQERERDYAIANEKRSDGCLYFRVAMPLAIHARLSLTKPKLNPVDLQHSEERALKIQGISKEEAIAIANENAKKECYPSRSRL
jgi:hypothetical protein